MNERLEAFFVCTVVTPTGAHVAHADFVNRPYLDYKDPLISSIINVS